MSRHKGLRVKVFADGADLINIKLLADKPTVRGFTTNPTLMRQAGVSDYLQFARQALEIVGDRPLSLEVFSDEFSEMERQARILAGLGPNVNVKIPITNSLGETSQGVIQRLSSEGVRVNVTAIFTLRQIERVLPGLADGVGGYVSVFAGRIADAGIDPLPTMSSAVELLNLTPNVELIWASPREVLNVVQASECGCHIITVTADLLKKVGTLGKDLDTFSLETVQMFSNDAAAAGYKL